MSYRADAPCRPPAGLRCRHYDQVNVIGHQAIRPNLHRFFTAPLGHQFHVGHVVSIAEKRLLPAIPSLRDVVGQTWHDAPCQSCFGNFPERF